MGAPPDLPDPSENDLRPMEAVHVPFSDESDNELMDHDGYELIPTLDDFNDSLDQAEEERLNDLSSQMQSEQQYPQAEVDAVAPIDPNLPSIESADIEIARNVWNAPRQEINITLDEQRTAQILNAMASFTLPNITLPEWADPEERWKEELLQRIRQRKEAQEEQTSNKGEKST